MGRQQSDRLQYKTVIKLHYDIKCNILFIHSYRYPRPSWQHQIVWRPNEDLHTSFGLSQSREFESVILLPCSTCDRMSLANVTLSIDSP